MVETENTEENVEKLANAVVDLMSLKDLMLSMTEVLKENYRNDQALFLQDWKDYLKE